MHQSLPEVCERRVKLFRRTRRKRQMTPFDESTLPATEPATVEEATSEGLMLAEYASRMKVKNAIIVRVLRRRETFEADDYIADATDALEHLAVEFDAAADRIAGEAASIANLRGSAAHAHDYRAGDSANLRHRETVLRALVMQLRLHHKDREYLLGLVEGARQDAWADIARAIEDALDRTTIVVDETYERQRARRMRLVAADLKNLAADLDN